MSKGPTVNWVLKHPWSVALVVIVCFGYSVGKDKALRDNATTAAQIAGPR